MTTSIARTTKPRTIAEVVRLLVAQAQQDGTAMYVFRGTTYGAKVAVDDDGSKSGQVWKMVAGERRAVGDPVFKAGYETYASGVINIGRGSDFFNHIPFGEDGTPLPLGTWGR